MKNARDANMVHQDLTVDPDSKWRVKPLLAEARQRKDLGGAFWESKRC